MVGKLDRVRALLDAGASPNARWSTHGDRFPLEEAIEDHLYSYSLRDRIEIIRVLLQHGADPNARWCPFETRGSYSPSIKSCNSKEGMTLLIMSAILDQADITHLLLEAGADPALEDWSGATALDYAHGATVFSLLQATMSVSSVARSAAERAQGTRTPNRVAPRAPGATNPEQRTTEPRTPEHRTPEHRTSNRT
jgi:ankyrin repeat protein